MSEALAILFGSLSVAFALAFTLVCIAWVTVLPTIGFLFMIGYLR